jgi:hypothetical protein
MSKVESIERDIQELTGDELSVLRRWFAEFDAQAWDRQFEDDIRAGRLDEHAERALRAHAAGESTRL